MQVRYPILLLDADDTLFDFQKGERNALKQLFREMGHAFSPDILTRYREINEALWRRHEAGEITKEQLQAERFPRLFEELSLKGDGLLGNQRYLAHLAEQDCLTEGALEVCRELAPFCRMYIVTNGVSSVQKRRVSKSPLRDLISGIFVSEDTGSQKPQREFFDWVFARIPHKGREDMLMVGDSLTSDIQGGIHAGIATCWFNPNGKDILGEVKPRYQISSLGELSDIVLSEK